MTILSEYSRRMPVPIDKRQLKAYRMTIVYIVFIAEATANIYSVAL